MEFYFIRFLAKNNRLSLTKVECRRRGTCREVGGADVRGFVLMLPKYIGKWSAKNCENKIAASTIDSGNNSPQGKTNISLRGKERGKGS